MKTRFYSILMAVACIIGLQSCDNDDDNLRVSPELQKAFLEKYPAATRVEWETKAGYYVADFYDNASEASAWFTPAGVWCMTETDVLYVGLNREIIALGLLTTLISWNAGIWKQYMSLKLKRNHRKWICTILLKGF